MHISFRNYYQSTFNFLSWMGGTQYPATSSSPLLSHAAPSSDTDLFWCERTDKGSVPVLDESNCWGSQYCDSVDISMAAYNSIINIL